jgi:hypothetical protein
MLRSVGLLAGTAVVGVLALKLIGLLLLPLLGMLFGFVMFVLKLALIAGLAFLAYKIFTGWGKERGSEAS